MKRLLFVTTLIFVILFTPDIFARGRGRRGFAQKGFGFNYNQNSRPCIDNKKYNITEEDKKSLLFMYEEEKMARDIYIKLGEKWNLRPFFNIQKSEQRHMDSIKYLLDKYSIKVPVKDEVGVFSIPEIKKLYSELLEKGLKSQKDALETGKLIEVTDINDLEKRIKNTTPDIKTVFIQLKRGSENHLRAFKSFL